MLTYLIQATVIWALLLALYELLYRNRPAFTLNRLYLLFALLAGAVFPLAPLTLPGTGTGVLAGNVLQPASPVFLAATPAQEGNSPAGADWAVIAGWMYLAGALLMAVISLRGLIYILRTAIYGSFRQMKGYRIFHSGGKHAPFSFMGWIFIADPEQYSAQELLFVLRHEDAHNHRRHWLDVLLVQLFCVVFWFHPLVWRYRHCLKLVHEYEADRITAGNDGYDYGHFLLRQTLLKGVPAIAHSFHFSPIKKRIAMLTQQRKAQAWKYGFWLPAVCACLLLAARPAENNERVRVGDKTRFRGHDFYWKKYGLDSVQIEDAMTKEMTWVVVQRQDEIIKMDRDIVYHNDDPTIARALFNKDGEEMNTYAEAIFRKQFPNIPDSLRSISVSNIVIDEKGKVRYYDVECRTDKAAYYNVGGQALMADYTRALEKIMDQSPDWQPAKARNKGVKARLPGFDVYNKPYKIMKMEKVEK